MIILGIDAASKSASAALVAGESGKVLGEVFYDNGLTHSQTLLPAIDEVVRVAGIAKTEIDLVSVTRGPGSFTGLRIGLATAKGIAFARNLPCAGVSSLEALAYQVRGLFEGIVVCAFDARRSQVYAASFRLSGEKIQRLDDDQALPASELMGRLSAYEQPILLLGDGSSLCYNEKERLAHPELVRRAPAAVSAVRAASVAALGYRMYVQGRSVTVSELTPSYLRLSQAERERIARLEKEGLS